MNILAGQGVLIRTAPHEPCRVRGTVRTRSPWLAKMIYDKKKIPNRGLNKDTDGCMESHNVLTCVCYNCSEDDRMKRKETAGKCY